jgi:preprotein translocase subunit SecB
MYPSPLILDRHFFTKVEIDSHVDGNASAINLLNCQLELGRADDNQRLFQLTLKLKIDSPPDKKAFYTGEIHAVGIFRVIDSYPQEKAAEIVESYGASVLFAAMRELVLNITSRGPWTPLVLSTFSFVKPKEAQNPQTVEAAVSSP